jgi:XTP/dITP diphosphohydrolase
MRLVLASSNQGKLAEMGALLDGLGIELVAQSAFGTADAEETGATFIENALLKARHAAAASGLPALGDDSGLCVDALGGAPGLYSARYAGAHGDSAANIAKLLAALRDVPADARTAHFHCSIVLLRSASDPAPLVAEGRWAGRILDAPRGSNGFGYDPVFLDPATGCSAAELDRATKNRLSHRAQALAHLSRQLSASSAHDGTTNTRSTTKQGTSGSVQREAHRAHEGSRNGRQA